VSRLVRGFRQQAEQCAQHGSPLTAALLNGAADDLTAGGPTVPLMTPLEDLPGGAVPSLRFAGAVHRLVLERRAPEVALHYPSVGGTASPSDVWPAVRRLLEDQPDDVRPLLDRPVQTNEPGRSAVLLGGLLHVAARTRMPLRLLEIGASAGLNLSVDRYAYEVASGVVLGDPTSSLRLVRPWQGAYPPYRTALEVVERSGCDPDPLDPRSTADRTTLTSYVWADQTDRLERLRGAFAVAAAHPWTVRRETASALLARELAEPRPGVATVVWQSVVRQYLDPAERERVAALLGQAGAQARRGAPLAHLSMEPHKDADGVHRFTVSLTTWPGGTTRVLAGCQGHGPPVVWS
jgi:hypothetical protein